MSRQKFVKKCIKTWRKCRNALRDSTPTFAPSLCVRALNAQTLLKPSEFLCGSALHWIRLAATMTTMPTPTKCGADWPTWSVRRCRHRAKWCKYNYTTFIHLSRNHYHRRFGSRGRLRTRQITVRTRFDIMTRRCRCPTAHHAIISIRVCTTVHSRYAI